MGTKKDKTHNEVSERKQEQEKGPEQHGESQEDKSAGQDEELEREEGSEFHAVPELAQPTLVHIPIAPRSRYRKITRQLTGVLFKDSQDVMVINATASFRMLRPESSRLQSVVV